MDVVTGEDRDTNPGVQVLPPGPLPQAGLTNNGGQVWIFGMKTEKNRTKVWSTAGGSCEAYAYLLPGVCVREGRDWSQVEAALLTVAKRHQLPTRSSCQRGYKARRVHGWMALNLAVPSVSRPRMLWCCSAR